MKTSILADIIKFCIVPIGTIFLLRLISRKANVKREAGKEVFKYPVIIAFIGLGIVIFAIVLMISLRSSLFNLKTNSLLNILVFFIFMAIFALGLVLILIQRNIALSFNKDDSLTYRTLGNKSFTFNWNEIDKIKTTNNGLEVVLQNKRKFVLPYTFGGTRRLLELAATKLNKNKIDTAESKQASFYGHQKD